MLMRGTLPNVTHSLARGLVGFWPMNEGTGGVVSDLSGNRNTGAFVNAPVWTPGDKKSAIDFEAGNDDYVDCGPAFQITNQLTVIAKIKPESLTGYPTVASKWESSGPNDRQWKLVASWNGSAPFIDVSSTGGNDIYRKGTAPLTLGEWVTIAGVYDGTKLTLDFYKNGVLDNGALTGVVPASIFAATSVVQIGNGSTGTGIHRPFDGMVEYVYVWNRALSAPDILRFSSALLRVFERATSIGLVDIFYLPVWPTLTRGPTPATFKERIAYDPTIRSQFESGSVFTRQRYTAIKREWAFAHNFLIAADKTLLENLQAEVGIGSRPFLWRSRRDGNVYAVQLAGPIEFSVEPQLPSGWCARVVLVEV